MATQLGDLRIDSIVRSGDLWEITGRFESIYEQNVYQPSRRWGATALLEARRKLALPEITEDALLRGISHVQFETPRASTTRFSMVIRDKTLAEGLVPVEWESYALG